MDMEAGEGGTVETWATWLIAAEKTEIPRTFLYQYKVPIYLYMLPGDKTS